MLPLEVRRVKADLEGLVTCLIGAGVAEDQNFLCARQLESTTWEVSFGGAEHVSIALGDAEYAEIYQELVEKRSYVAKMIDGGLLHLMYLFAGRRLVRHRLAYFPSPDLRPFRDDPESYLRDALFHDIVSRRLVPSPVRFDFDEEAATEVSHPRCHMTLGDVKGCRIPVSSPLTPRWFFEFVLRNFYQTEQHEFVSALPHHRMSFECTISASECRLVHVVVPQAL